MPGPTLTPEEALELLAATPHQIEAMTAGLPDAQLARAPAAGEWSVNELLAHLRACADVRGSALLRILDEDRPRIRVINPRAYLKSTDYLKLDFAPSFRAFASQRADLLGVLRGLPPEAWSRPAEIVRATTTVEGSVLYYAEWIAAHEVPHLGQIRATVEALSG